MDVRDCVFLFPNSFYFANCIPIDTDITTAVAWTPDNQLVSSSDDKTLCKWSAEGEQVANQITVDVFISRMSWFPTVGKQVC